MNLEEKIKKLDEDLKSGKITKEVYEKEVERVTYRNSIEEKNTLRKRKFIIAISVCALIGIIALLFINRYYLFGKEYINVPDLNDLKAPVQGKAQGTKRITIDGKYTYITKVHTYTIQAKVIDVQQYMEFNYMNKLSPVDFGLAWGFMAEDKNQDKLTFSSNGSRFLRFHYNDDGWLASVGGHNAVNQHVSNNHMIPANKKIKNQLISIKKGDFVQFEGFLVNVYSTVENESFTWHSSDSRIDTGDGACEIIYVTDVKWLKQKK